MKKYIIKMITVIVVVLISINCFSQSNKSINVKEWGAKGDGISDDYYALLKIADTVSKMGNAEVFFPAGVYKINQYHDGKNNLKDIIFRNCNGLKITGEKAIISVMGNFYRPITRRGNKHVFSNISAIIPFRFFNCNNLQIEGIEINGNVNEMTREKGVNETGGHLLLLTNCKNVNISDLNLHHAQTDGIMITGEKNESITMNNLVSSNNARQGMSIIQLINGTFKNCRFINTGITGGKYGRHAPSAGIDIEPDKKTTQVVKNIKFENCLFENNVGSQFVSSFPTTTDSVYFEKCTFNSSDSSSKYTIIVNAKGINFNYCTFNCRNGSIYPAWQMEGSSATFNNCTINSNTNGIVAVVNFTTSKVTMENCKINYTGNTVLDSYFPYIRMKDFTFVNNEINIPEKYLKNNGINGLIQNSINVGNNSFISNGKNVKSTFSFTGSNIK
jgi:hypothetical protein